MRISDWSSDVCSSDLIRAMIEGASGDSALIVSITDRDRPILVAAHGYADIDRRIAATADTRFAIGSISKSFAAVALMQMADEGRFDPEAPIARYLPDFHVRSSYAPITGASLMSHTSGLPKIGRASCRERVCQSV